MEDDLIYKYLEIQPVLTNKHNLSDFPSAFNLSPEINSKELGIINTSKGLKKPRWFDIVNTFKKDLIVIDNLDNVDIFEQEKFYELLNYNTISSVNFNFPVKIVVTYGNLEKINTNIRSLCRVIK